MVKLKILLYDVEYMRAFVDRLPYCDISIDAEVVNSIDEVGSLTDSVILTDKSIDNESIDRRKIIYLFVSKNDIASISCENDSNVEDMTESGEHYIFKYSAVRDVVAEISQIYTDIYNCKGKLNTGGCEIITVCSSEEYEGNVSIISRFVARQVAHIRHSRVLLISMRELNPFSCDSGHYGLDRLIYTMMDGRSISLENFFFRDEYGVYYFRTNEYINRLNLLSSDDLEWFLGHLSKLFQVMVFHIGSTMNEKNINHIESSDCCFCVGFTSTELHSFLSSYPSDKYCELRWTNGLENGEVMVVDFLNRFYGGDSNEFE